MKQILKMLQRRRAAGFVYILLVLSALMIEKKKIKIRRWRAKPHLDPFIRNEMKLINYFRYNDAEEFFKLFRMSPDQFNDLLGLLRLRLRKKKFLRETIFPDVQLAFTLA